MRRAHGSSTSPKPIYYRVAAPVAFVIAVSGVAGCGSGSGSKAGDTGPGSTTSSGSSTSAASSSGSETAGVAPALPGSTSAPGDVTVAKRVTIDAYGSASVQIVVTNHSGRPSDYVIGLALVSASGAQLATKLTFVNGLAASRSVARTVNFLQVHDTVPAGAHATLRSAQRISSP